MLNKHRAFLAAALFFMAALCYGNIHILNMDKLPDNEAFKINLATLREVHQYAGHYSFEWNYNVDKNKLIEFLQAFHNDLIRVNTSNDYELNLLDTVILTYLYNLDADNIFNKVTEKIEMMKRDFPLEYRTYWIYGNFLVSAAYQYQGYNEFIHMMNIFDIDLNVISMDFLYDYAYSCIMVQMMKSGLGILELAASRGGTPAADHGLYQSISRLVNNVEIDNKYDGNDVWKIIKSNGNYYLQSRVLGSLLPLKETWDLRIWGLENKKSICIITPDRMLSAKGNAIQITVLLEYDFGNESYSDFRQRKQNTYPVIDHSVININSREYDVFTYEDPSRYQNMGGAKGYYITTTLEYSSGMGAKIELPLDFNPSNPDGGGPAYYAFANFYDRIKKDINVAIFIDSSNEIFAEATDFIFAYLAEIIFE